MVTPKSTKQYPQGISPSGLGVDPTGDFSGDKHPADIDALKWMLWGSHFNKSIQLALQVKKYLKLKTLKSYKQMWNVEAGKKDF